MLALLLFFAFTYLFFHSITCFLHCVTENLHLSQPIKLQKFLHVIMIGGEHVIPFGREALDSTEIIFHFKFVNTSSTDGTNSLAAMSRTQCEN